MTVPIKKYEVAIGPVTGHNLQGYQSSSHTPSIRMCTYQSTFKFQQQHLGREKAWPPSCFSSYEQLDLRVKREKFVQLTHRAQFKDTGGCSRKGVMKWVEEAKSDPQYYTVHFGCVFGGKGYASKATGQQSHQRYIQ